MSVNIDTSKLDQRIRTLKTVTEELTEKVVTALAFQGERLMKIEAPVKTGRLRNSIEALIQGETATVGTSVEYAPDVAFPTRAHIIRPKQKQALAWPGGPGPRRSVRHPGTKGNPFHLRAMVKLRAEAQDVANEIIQRELARV